MKDCKGRELQVGDTVVYVKGKNTTASLATGKVTKFYKGYYAEECSVDSQSHITSERVMKLNESEV